MGNIKIDAYSCSNSIINFNALLENITQEIQLKCAVPEYLIREDAITLGEVWLKRRQEINKLVTNALFKIQKDLNHIDKLP